MDFELSQLHFHSWGLVAENAAVGQKVVQVTPVEFRFGEDEIIVDNPVDDELEYLSEEGQESVKVVRNLTIPCTWLKWNSNRVTPPNVRRNDDVLIYRLGMTDKYYWMDFNIANVKRLETVVWAFSGDPNNPINDDLSNAYRFEISTHGKLVTFTTSQANGEPFGYTHQYDTETGVVTLADTVGNTIYLNSAQTEIGMVNADRTSLKLTKKDIVAYAPDNVQWTAVNAISFKCNTMDIVATESLKIKTNDFLADTPTATFTGLVKSKTLEVSTGGTFGSVASKTITADSATFKSHGPH